MLTTSHVLFVLFGFIPPLLARAGARWADGALAGAEEPSGAGGVIGFFLAPLFLLLLFLGTEVLGGLAAVVGFATLDGICIALGAAGLAAAPHFMNTDGSLVEVLARLGTAYWVFGGLALVVAVGRLAVYLRRR